VISVLHAAGKRMGGQFVISAEALQAQFVKNFTSRSHAPANHALFLEKGRKFLAGIHAKQDQNPPHFRQKYCHNGFSPLAG
jgi:hypothetical protein